jgi:hypothetical protein
MRRISLLIFGCLLVFAWVGTGGAFRRAAGLEVRIDEARAAERRQRVDLERLRLEDETRTKEDQEATSTRGSLGTGDATLATEAHRLLVAIGDFKAWIDRAQPRPRLPELRFLKEKDWVKAMSALGDSRSDADYLAAWKELRNATIVETGSVLSKAVGDYEHDSGGEFPQDIVELDPYLPGKPDPSLLGRYQLVDGPKGRRISSVPGIFDTDPPDNYEAYVSVDSRGSVESGYGTRSPRSTPLWKLQ